MPEHSLKSFDRLPWKERWFVRGRLASAPLAEMASRARGATLLDVGCGHGALVALLVEGHPERQVVGIDPDARKIGWAQASVGRNPRVTAIRMAITAVLAVVAFRMMVVPIRVTGISMQPTFKDGQRAYFWRLGPWSTPLERSDIVAIRMAGERVLVMKRIIAMSGERVAIRGGHVFVDDNELEEPYVSKDRAPWNYPADARERKVPGNQVLVIGDNRSMPEKHHMWGLVDKERIVGKLRR